MMWGYGSGWGALLLMSLSMLLWIVVLGLLVWVAVRWITVRGTNQQMVAQPISPLEILEQRYARGEIDALTFQRMRADVEATRSPNAR